MFLTSLQKSLAIVFFFLLLDSTQQALVRLTPRVYRNTNDSCLSEDSFKQVRASVSREVSKLLLVNISTVCGGEGWRRVADVDMTKSSQSCPSGLTLYNNPLRLCGRTLATTYDFCESTAFRTGGSSYSEVCGRIKGYQVGQGYSFWGRTDLEHSYVDGVSLTHGAPGTRQHIWTFAIAFDNENTGISNCPSNSSEAPSFITDNYFCDSGNTPNSIATNRVYTGNPLWDGVGCRGDPFTPPRCYVNNPPWFQKTLPRATSDDIELRICGYSNVRWGDTYLQEIELYVR